MYFILWCINIRYFNCYCISIIWISLIIFQLPRIQLITATRSMTMMTPENVKFIEHFQRSNFMHHEILSSSPSLTSIIELLFSYFNKYQNHRNKRFLIYNGGGIIKLVIGFSEPLKFPSKKPYRQLSVIYNFQMQYMPPRESFNIFSSIIWNDEENRMNKGKLLNDFNREYVYSLIENGFESYGLNGRECLLKILCEVGKFPIYGDAVIYQILRKIFPSKLTNVHNDYIDATKAGSYGVDCKTTYHKCTIVTFIEKYSVFL